MDKNNFQFLSKEFPILFVPCFSAVLKEKTNSYTSGLGISVSLEWNLIYVNVIWSSNLHLFIYLKTWWQWRCYFYWCNSFCNFRRMFKRLMVLHGCLSTLQLCFWVLEHCDRCGPTVICCLRCTFPEICSRMPTRINLGSKDFR